MKESGFNKIVIVSLCYDYTKIISQKLAEYLGIMFCDVNDLIEYDLSDVIAMQELCSKEYFLKREMIAVKRISSFENVVVAMDFDMYIHSHTMFAENSLVVFFDLSKKYIEGHCTISNVLSCDQRRERVRDLADVTLRLIKTDVDYVCQKVLDKIGSVL